VEAKSLWKVIRTRLALAVPREQGKTMGHGKIHQGI